MAAERGRELFPEAFPGAQQRFASRRVSRLCSHKAPRLLNVSAVGESQTTAMHGGRGRACLPRTPAFLFLSFLFPSSLQTLQQLIYLPCTFSSLHPSTFFSLRPLQKMESLSSSRAPLALIKKHSEINRGCGRRSGLREEVACGVTVLLLLLFCLDSVSSLQQ